jgi:hypothetical protein
MGRIAVNIGYDAKDVVLSGDPDKAAKLADDDEALDELHRHLFSVVMDHQWPHPIATAVDVTLLSRYYDGSPTTQWKLAAGSSFKPLVARSPDTTRFNTTPLRKSLEVSLRENLRLRPPQRRTIKRLSRTFTSRMVLLSLRYTCPLTNRRESK